MGEDRVRRMTFKLGLVEISGKSAFFVEIPPKEPDEIDPAGFPLPNVPVHEKHESMDGVLAAIARTAGERGWTPRPE